MGFSVRDQQWRYTAWVPFNGTRALWSQGASAEELYAHAYPLNTTSMDAVDDVVNVAYEPKHQKTRARYFALVREFFETISPPTAPPGPPTGV